MRGTMQHRPLLVADLIAHAARHHGGTPIVALASTGTVRTTYAQVEARARRLAQALGRLGVRRGDRVATLAWNDHRHLELYYGISGAGFVCHTVNPRLFLEQIVFILGHAADRVVFYDPDFATLVAVLRPRLPAVEAWVSLDEAYEDLIAVEDGAFAWPALDEAEGASLCYTSGTTGEPKGVLYSHRSSVLHAYASAMPDAFALSARSVVLPASSMYHANAWGVPYAATLVGAPLVLPGRALDGASLVALIGREGVTHAFGVPTVWLGVRRHVETSGASLAPLSRVVVSGAACPPALAAFFERRGIAMIHMWGMTETSPIGVVNAPKRGVTSSLAQGRAPFGVDIDLVDEAGASLPWDGRTPGALLVRGHWVAERYFDVDASALDAGGWLPTGDVATIDPDCFLTITDRAKDLIKSGGEWISSIALEAAAMAHPAVAEAAVVGVPHPIWDERPLMLVVRHADAVLDDEALKAFLRERVARWEVPDAVLFVDDLPHTATGKLAKRTLRENHAAHYGAAVR